MNFRATFEFDNPLPAPSRRYLKLTPLTPYPSKHSVLTHPTPLFCHPFLIRFCASFHYMLLKRIRSSILYSLHTTQTYPYYNPLFTACYSNIFVLRPSLYCILLKLIRSTTILSLHTTQTYSFYNPSFTTYYSNVFVLQPFFHYILL